MKGTEAIAVLKGLFVGLRYREDISPSELAELVAMNVGGLPPDPAVCKACRRRTANAERMRKNRPSRTLDEHIERTDGTHAAQTEDTERAQPSAQGGAMPSLSESPDLDPGSSPENSPVLLALSEGPDSKRARSKSGPRRSRFVPVDWYPNGSHFALAAELGLHQVAELAKFRECEFKNPISDWDLAYTRWLKRAAEFATRANGAPKTSVVDQLKARAAALRAAEEAQ